MRVDVTLELAQSARHVAGTEELDPLLDIEAVGRLRRGAASSACGTLGLRAGGLLPLELAQRLHRFGVTGVERQHFEHCLRRDIGFAASGCRAPGVEPDRYRARARGTRLRELAAERLVLRLKQREHVPFGRGVCE